jgi:hypothetical protein
MVSNEIYTGLRCKVTGQEGSWEVIKKEEFLLSAWCKRIDSNSHDMREFTIGELERI